MMLHARRRRVLFIALAIAVSVAAIASAQPWRGAGRAKGVVLDPAGKPIAGAKVSVTWAQDEGGGPPATKTDDKGKWSFIGLTAGDWKLSVEAEGYQPFDEGFPVYAQGAPDTLRATLVPVPVEDLEAAREAARLEAVNAALGEGNRLAGAGEFAAARSSYQKALDLVEGAKKAEVLAAVASTYVQEKNLDEGVRQLEQALAIDPKNETALRLMVSVLAAQKKDEEAKKYLALLPDEGSLDAGTQINLGIMRYNEGKLEEAGQIFERVVATSPDRAEAYYFAGLVHLNSQRNDLALERLEKFVELAPSDARSAEAREFIEHLKKQANAQP